MIGEDSASRRSALGIECLPAADDHPRDYFAARAESVAYGWGCTIRFCTLDMGYGEPGAWLTDVGVAVNTKSFPAG